MFQKSKPLDVWLTLANMDRFSKFFHQVIRKKILYVYVTKISISPAICCYTTLWKSKIQNVTDFDSTLTDCWHVPEDTLRTWFNTLNVWCWIRQTVSRLLTMTDWLTDWHSEVGQMTSRINSWTLFSWTLLHHGDFFTVIIFAPSSFFSRLYFICCTHI